MLEEVVVEETIQQQQQRQRVVEIMQQQQQQQEEEQKLVEQAIMELISTTAAATATTATATATATTTVATNQASTSNAEFFFQEATDGHNSNLRVNYSEQEECVCNEINVIQMQQKYRLLQAEALRLPTDSQRRRLEFKIGILKYKILSLERLQQVIIKKSNFDYVFIREQAEILFIKSLREKVFVSKKLIAVPRLRQKK